MSTISLLGEGKHHSTHLIVSCEPCQETLPCNLSFSLWTRKFNVQPAILSLHKTQYSLKLFILNLAVANLALNILGLGRKGKARQGKTVILMWQWIKLSNSLISFLLLSTCLLKHISLENARVESSWGIKQASIKISSAKSFTLLVVA